MDITEILQGMNVDLEFAHYLSENLDLLKRIDSLNTDSQEQYFSANPEKRELYIIYSYLTQLLEVH